MQRSLQICVDIIMISMCETVPECQKNKTKPSHTHLFSIFVTAATRPEEVGTDTDGSALVGLFQQLRGSQCTLSPQRLVVLLTEASHSFKGPNDQCDGCQLSFGVTDLILVQREGLERGAHQFRGRNKECKKNNGDGVLLFIGVKRPGILNELL